MTKKILLFISIFFLIFSCKKKSETTQEPAATQQTNTPIQTGAYGKLSISVNSVYYTGGFDVDTFIVANFSVDSVNYSPYWTTNVGDVYLNGNGMLLTIAGTASYNNESLLPECPTLTSPSTWSISGNPNTLPYTYTFTPNIPSFTGISQLPDSFSLSSNLTLTITGVSNLASQQFTVKIKPYVTSQNIGLSKNILTVSGQSTYICTFTSAELSSSLWTSNIGDIRIEMTNTTTDNFNGKTLEFLNCRNSWKNVKIQP